MGKRGTSTRASFTLAAFLALILSGCCHRPDLRGVQLPTPPAASPLDAWGDYMRFLEGVADGALYDQWQLSKTVDYFTSVTSIQTRLEMTGLGYTLDVKALREDLQAWKQWRLVHQAP